MCFTVNNFREQFFVMCFLESFPSALVQPSEKGSKATAESCSKCLPAVIFLSRRFTHYNVGAEFYAHFICTYGTQINYKRELSSKLFKDHFYCSL